MDPITASALIAGGSSLLGGVLNRLFGGGGGGGKAYSPAPLTGAGFNAPIPQPAQTPPPSIGGAGQAMPGVGSMSQEQIDAILRRYLGGQVPTFSPQDLTELNAQGYAGF